MTPTNDKWEELIRENCWDSPQGIMTKSRMLKKDGEFVGWVTETLTVDMVVSKFSKLLLERERELEEHRYKLAEAIIEVMREFTVDLPVGHPHQHPMEESILRMYIVKILGQEKALSKAQSLLSRDYLVK